MPRTALRLLAAVAVVLGHAWDAGADPVVDATLEDALAVSDGQANPGDTLIYTVTITLSGDMDAESVLYEQLLDPNTTLVPGSLNTFPIAQDDAYGAVGNTVHMVVDAADGVLANDIEVDPGQILTVYAVDDSLTQGTVSVNLNGSFTYDPPAGTTGIVDSFGYTVGDGAGGFDTATVTISINGLVWYVDNTAGSGGAGTLTDPFDTLADAETASQPGDMIFVFEGDGSSTGQDTGIVLKSNQKLAGQGIDFVVMVDGTPTTVVPATNPPVITNAAGNGVTLAQNNMIQGLSIGDGATPVQGTGLVGATAGTLGVDAVSITANPGAALDLDAVDLAASFDSLSSSNSPAEGVRITDSSGAFAVGNTTTILGPGTDGIFLWDSSALPSSASFDFGLLGDLTTTNGAGIVIDNVGSVGLGGAPSIAATGGPALDVTDTDTGAGWAFTNLSSSASPSEGVRLQGVAGNVTVTNVTDANASSGPGVVLQSNAGTFNLGDLMIAPGAGAEGLLANDGGTLNTNGGTVTTNGAPALSLVDTTIGGSGVTFDSISASGGSNGIVLDNTGAGSFMVTGTDTTDGSGGTLQNISSRGASFTNAQNVTLRNMNFVNASTSDAAGNCNALTNSGCNAAIHLSNVTGVDLVNLSIDDSSQQCINGLNVVDLILQDSLVTDCGTGVNEHGLRLHNLSGMSSISNSTLSFPAQAAASIANDSGTLVLNVTNSTFSDTQSSGTGADGLEVRSRSSANTKVDVENSSFLRNRANGLQAFAEDSSTVRVDVTGSTFDPEAGIGIGIDLAASDTATFDFNVINNPGIDSRGGSAVNVFADGSAVVQGRVNGNTINVADTDSGFGIRAQANSVSDVTLQIDGNTITDLGFDAGIQAIARLGSGRLDATISNNNVTVDPFSLYDIWVQANDFNTTCANVINNTASGNAIAAFRQRTASPGATVLLQGFTTDAATTWTGNGNTGSPVSSSNNGTLAGGTCATVTHPLP